VFPQSGKLRVVVFGERWQARTASRRYHQLRSQPNPGEGDSASWGSLAEVAKMGTSNGDKLC